jgi:hypothetical protein
MTTKDQTHADLRIVVNDNAMIDSQRHSAWLRNMRRSRAGSVGQNPNTQYVVQIQTYPAASNLTRGLIYTPIGADLLLSNTKSLFVHGVEYVLNYVAPSYYQMSLKPTVAAIPYVGELFALAGLIILVDGVIRLAVGGRRAYINSGLISV